MVLTDDIVLETKRFVPSDTVQTCTTSGEPTCSGWGSVSKDVVYDLRQSQGHTSETH